MKKLIYACPSDSGGILDYAVYQAGALLKEGSKTYGNGFELHFICHQNFPIARLPPEIIIHKFRAKRDLVGKRGFLFKVSRLFSMIADQRSEATQVSKLALELLKINSTRQQLPATRHSRTAEVCVLFDCYKEYFALFWIWPLRRLAKKGVVMGTITHDPVRDFVLGPLWWHRWSVRLGYSFLRYVFVHDDTAVDFGGSKPHAIQVHQIPFAAFPLCPSSVDREESRKRLGFAASDIVFFAFGQIRDGKNLDLFLRTMAKLQENVKLLVAGQGHSVSSRPPEFYLNLAEELGVAHRCCFEIRRVSDQEVGELFNAIDFTLLTYSVKFRSMSAVLATALTARKPVLASSGPGPLKTVVNKYQLGVFVEPDDSEEILKGAKQLLAAFATNAKCEKGNSKPISLSSLDFSQQPATHYQSLATLSPDWDCYMKDNSWEENARRVYQAFGGPIDPSDSCRLADCILVSDPDLL
jgi:glycosyltransferase involved in cell wall biosynthesis